MSTNSDALIRATTQVDVSGLQAGMQSAVSIAKAALDQLKAQYEQASIAVKAAAENLASVQRQVGQVTATTNAQVTQLIGQLQNELTQASATQQALATQVAQAEAQLAKESVTAAADAAALQTNTAAAAENAAAAEAMGVAHAQAVPQMIAASSAIRVIDGALPIRAVERFAVSVLGLGPILQAAFPIVGAIAFGEVIAHIVEEFEDWLHDVKELKALNETIGKQQEENHRKVLEYQKQAKEAQFQTLGIEKGRSAEYAARSTDLQAQIAADTAALNQDKERLAAIHLQIEELRKIRSTPTETRVGRGGAEFTVPGSEGLAADQTKQLKELEVQMTSISSNMAATQAKIAAETAKVGRDAAEETKHAAEEQKRAQSEAESALRKKEEDLRKADEDALDAMRLANTATLAEQEAFWTKRLSAESGFTDRVREIKHELARIQQEEIKADAEYWKKREEDLVKASELQTREAGANAPEGFSARARLKDLQEQLVGAEAFPTLWKSIMDRIPEVTKAALRETEEAVKKSVDQQYEAWSSAGHRTLQETLVFWEGVKSIALGNEPLIEEAGRKIAETIQKIREEEEKAAKTTITEQQDRVLAGIEAQSAALERQRALRVFVAPTAGVDQLVQQREIDQQIINEKIATQQRLLALDQQYYGIHSAQAQADELKLEQIREQGNLKIYRDTTAVLQKEQQIYTNFFNQVNQGWIRAIDGILTTNQSFARGMQQLWQGLLKEFYNFVAEKILTWIEGTVVIKAAETALNQALVALHLAKAAETATIDKGVATTTAVSNIATSAAQGAAAAAASTAAIPIIGPELAPGVAAATYAEILAWASLAAFERGGIVPNTGVAMVHGGEAVLPQPLTTMLTNVANNQRSVRGGDLNIHGGINVHGGGSNTGRDIVRQLTGLARSRNLQMA